MRSTSPSDGWSAVWVPLKLCAHITQRGCNNTQEKVKGKTFFSHKVYLATVLHIRPPQCLSVFQQRQHCQKTQKQAVRYHSGSHGNRPAEGVPAPTLICTNSAQADFPACRTNQEGGEGDGGERCSAFAASPPGLFLPEPGPPTEPWYQCKRLAGPRLWKVPQGGKKDQDSWDAGPAELVRTLPLLFNKDHTFPAAGAAPGRQSCSSKPAGAADDRESKQQSDRRHNKQTHAEQFN